MSSSAFTRLFKSVEQQRNFSEYVCDKLLKASAANFVEDATCCAFNGFCDVAQQLNNARVEGELESEQVELLEEALATSFAKVVERILARYRSLYSGIFGARALVLGTSKSVALFWAKCFIDYLIRLNSEASNPSFVALLSKKLGKSDEMKHLFAALRNQSREDWEGWADDVSSLFELDANGR